MERSSLSVGVFSLSLSLSLCLSLCLHIDCSPLRYDNYVPNLLLEASTTPYSLQGTPSLQDQQQNQPQRKALARFHVWGERRKMRDGRNYYIGSNIWGFSPHNIGEEKFLPWLFFDEAFLEDALVQYSSIEETEDNQQQMKWVGQGRANVFTY